MRILEDVSFFDSAGKEWKAPAGSIVDGASIPRAFWTAIGSPFVGMYRRASVIHDVACQDRTEPHRAVHDMLFEAMILDGVPLTKARIMHDAVMTTGPKWSADGTDLIVYGGEDEEML